MQNKTKFKSNFFIFIVKIYANIIGSITKLIKFKYYYNFLNLFFFIVPKNILAHIRINKDSFFCFYLDDPYYARFFYKNYIYEEEIFEFLNLLKNKKILFLDCGANYGYWSILASSKIFGSQNVISVEPLKSNFEILRKNNKLNNYRMNLYNYALGKKKEKSLIYFSNNTKSNVGASLQYTKDKKNNKESVKITTIDNIISKYKKKDIVVKLDVEGHEEECLEGAKKTLRYNSLVIYEDHGNDKKCRVSKYLFKKNFQIFYFSNKRFIRITNIKQIKQIKKSTNKGYNFFATKNFKFIKILRQY